MKLKTFIFLVVISLILGVMAYKVVEVKSPIPQHSRLGQQPFVNYPLDRTAAIKVVHAAGSVILEKEGLTWVVADRFRYPADFEKIADLVQKLTESRVGDAFEVFPDTLDRLHLHDPASPDIAADRKGLRVVFQDEHAQPLLDVILGRAREGATGGHYVLAEGSGVGYLVNRDFSPFSGQSLDWTDKRLLDVRPEDIERVVCEDPRSGRVLYTLARPAPDYEPVWVEAKPQDSVSDHRIDVVFRALINLSMEDVVGRADDPGGPPPDPAGPRLVYHLYDGTIYTIHPGATLAGSGNRYFLRLSAAYAPPPEGNPEFSGRFPETPDPVEQRDRASKLNDRLAPWVYVVQDWRHGNFIVDPAAFVAPAE